MAAPGRRRGPASRPTMRRRSRLPLPAAVLLLCACGGGGGSISIRGALAFGPPLPPTSMDPVALAHLKTGPGGVWGQQLQPEEGAASARPTPKDILCLDFDGVICNSVGESSRAAYRSVRKLWPQLATYCTPLSTAMAGPDGVPDIPSWLAESLRQLRPLVETGYENVLLARLCMEQYLQGAGTAPKLNVKDMGTKWAGSLRSALLHRYGVTAQDLVDLFGSVRDEWLAEDPEGWIKANAFYAGSDLSLGCGNLDAYVITTKQTRFVETLLQSRGITLPRERIFGLGSGPKTDVLARLLRLTREKATADPTMEREPTLHFVEDRVETLEKVCSDPRLQNVQLYLADWGYNTPEQVARARLNPRIRVIDLADFSCMCRALDPSKSDFQCVEAVCAGCRCASASLPAVERFAFQATPPTTLEAEEEEIRRTLMSITVGLGEEEDEGVGRGEEEEDGMEELTEEALELLELMAMEDEDGGSGREK